MFILRRYVEEPSNRSEIQPVGPFLIYPAKMAAVRLPPGKRANYAIILLVQVKNGPKSHFKNKWTDLIHTKDPSGTGPTDWSTNHNNQRKCHEKYNELENE